MTLVDAEGSGRMESTAPVPSHPPAPLAATIASPRTVVQLCAGGGGLAVAERSLGYTPVALIEEDPRCVRTLLANGFENVIHARIQNIDFTQFRGATLLSAGLPPDSDHGARVTRGDGAAHPAHGSRGCRWSTRRDRTLVLGHF